MALNATYDAALSRVRLAATSLPAGTTYAKFERSANQVTWAVVRGGDAVPVVASAASLDDYEFSPDVANYYRCSPYSDALPSFIAAGAGAVDANAAGTSTIAPAIPAGLTQGRDTVFALVSVRTGVPAISGQGWTRAQHFDVASNVQVFTKAYTAGMAAPTVSVSASAANATLLGQCFGYRNVGAESTGHLDSGGNASAANITVPTSVVAAADRLVLIAGWRAQDWTSVAPLATPAGTAEAGELTSGLGDNAGQVLDHLVTATPPYTFGAPFVVTGGVAGVGRAAIGSYPQVDTLTGSVLTANVTPDLGGVVWIKSIARPFLNRPLKVLDFSDITRPSRSGVFEVVSRSYPVEVADIRGSQRFELTLWTEALAEAAELEVVLSAGDTALIHVPAGSPVPGGYVSIGDVTIGRRSVRGLRRYFTLPCTVVAAPQAGVVGATVTWQGVINANATWQDVITANPTWQDVINLIGDPTDVIVS